MKTMYEVNENIIKPITRARNCSYAELLPPQPLSSFVSHWWGEETVLFIASLELHAHARVSGADDPDDHIYWVCFVKNLWVSKEGT